MSANPSPGGRHPARERPVEQPPVAPGRPGFDGDADLYADVRRPAGETAPAGPPPGRDWRSTVATASGLNAIVGISLIIAPFVLGYGTGDPYWNDIVFGAAILVMGTIRAAGAYREAWLSWLNALAGAWIFFSAFWLDNTARAAWNDAIAGAVVVILALLSAGAGEDGAAPAWYRR